MNRKHLLAFLMISCALSFCAYTLDVDRSGTAYATLSIGDGEQAEVPVPADAWGFRIVGGSYSLSNGTAYVSPGQSGFCTFSFSTSLLTSKSDGGWKLSFSPPQDSEAKVFLPTYATLENSFPQPDSVSSEGSRMQLEIPYSRSVNVYYRLGEAPAPDGAGAGWDFIIAATAILCVAAIAASLFLRGRRNPLRHGQAAQAPAAGTREQIAQPSLELTAGKREMMETFNENDKKIADYLLANAGRCRRNELERKSGISKSSLAMALNRLERRKIVEIDRTSTTHFVRLTDYFLRL